MGTVANQKVMWRTRQKLAEARFFLSKLDEHRYDNLTKKLQDPTAREAFSYYLSAFITAARSVTWIMRSEYNQLPKWEDWWKSQVPVAAVAKLLRLFTELRNRSQKAEPLIPGNYIRIEGDGGPPIDRDPEMPKMQITITAADDESNRPILSGEVLAFTWTIDDLDGEDLLKSCRAYFEELEGLIASCESHFVE